MKNKLHFKYNNANFAIVCGKCSKILKVGSEFTKEEWAALHGDLILPNQLCHDCLEKMIANDEEFKHWT